MEKFFNTAGPIIPEDHYYIPYFERIDWEEIRTFLARKRYFVLHAPRQTGKTTVLLEMMRIVNSEDRYTALYVNIEGAQAMGNDTDRGIEAVCSAIARSASVYLQDRSISRWLADDAGGKSIPPGDKLTSLLTWWSQNSGRPVVLFVDEVDALIGDTLISLLRQIRAGYAQRPGAFPQSIVLCGVRDVKDYRIHTRDNEIITGGSAFNIKTKSIKMVNFSEEQCRRLILQHTEETGQQFKPEIFRELWPDTKGQPWLVNALGYEMICGDEKACQNRSMPIDLKCYRQARERLIVSRSTHLDQLMDKLQEKRVREVISTILTGESEQTLADIRPDDQQYAEDLGLITTSPYLAIANKIYQEIIPRELAWVAQTRIVNETFWYIQEDGSLDVPGLLKAFQQFFREHSSVWLERFSYKEAGPHLLMQAFLQRIVNSGGRIGREYALGRKRTDLLVEWPLDVGKGFCGPVQKIVIELKLLRGEQATVIAKGVLQTAEYSRQVGAAESHLVIFDRRPEIPWNDKIWHRVEKYHEQVVEVWGC